MMAVKMTVLPMKRIFVGNTLTLRSISMVVLLLTNISVERIISSLMPNLVPVLVKDVKLLSQGLGRYIEVLKISLYYSTIYFLYFNILMYTILDSPLPHHKGGVFYNIPSLDALL